MTKQIWIAGVDEAGRGPLAGPVVASAVILDPTKPIMGLDDSKKLSEQKRERLYDLILSQALQVTVGQAEVGEIDTINILQATLLAMKRAILQLLPLPDKVLIDGTHCPDVKIPKEAIINGDALIPEISAASIVAKVTRDRLMIVLDQEHPQFGFKTHKGYGTAQHLAALERYGVTEHHRRSFAPVRKLLISHTETFSES